MLRWDHEVHTPRLSKMPSTPPTVLTPFWTCGILPAAKSTVEQPNATGVESLVPLQPKKLKHLVRRHFARRLPHKNGVGSNMFEIARHERRWYLCSKRCIHSQLPIFEGTTDAKYTCVWICLRRNNATARDRKVSPNVCCLAAFNVSLTTIHHHQKYIWVALASQETKLYPPRPRPQPTRTIAPLPF